MQNVYHYFLGLLASCLRSCCCCCSVKQELCKFRDREIRFLCPRPCLCCSHSCSPLSTLSPQAYKQKTDKPYLKVAPLIKQAALLKQRKKTKFHAIQELTLQMYWVHKSLLIDFSPSAPFLPSKSGIELASSLRKDLIIFTEGSTTSAAQEALGLPRIQNFPSD